jgi:hypothetical protein
MLKKGRHAQTTKQFVGLPSEENFSSLFNDRPIQKPSPADESQFTVSNAQEKGKRTRTMLVVISHSLREKQPVRDGIK